MTRNYVLALHFRHFFRIQGNYKKNGASIVFLQGTLKCYFLSGEYDLYVCSQYLKLLIISS